MNKKLLLTLLLINGPLIAHYTSFTELQNTIGAPERSVAMPNWSRVKGWSKQQEQKLTVAFNEALSEKQYQQASDIGMLMQQSGLRKQQALGKKWQDKVKAVYH